MYTNPILNLTRKRDAILLLLDEGDPILHEQTYNTREEEPPETRTPTDQLVSGQASLAYPGLVACCRWPGAFE